MPPVDVVWLVSRAAAVARAFARRLFLITAGFGRPFARGLQGSRGIGEPGVCCNAAELRASAPDAFATEPSAGSLRMTAHQVKRETPTKRPKSMAMNGLPRKVEEDGPIGGAVARKGEVCLWKWCAKAT